MRALLSRETQTLQKFVQKVRPKKVKRLILKNIAKMRKLDKQLLKSVKEQWKKSPTIKAARKIKLKMNVAGNKVSKRLVNLKVNVADKVDEWAAAKGKQISQTKVAQHTRQMREETVQRLDRIVAHNPNGHYAKAVMEFRASGKAIRAHLGKVWGEASHELNKDLSQLLGKRGSVQADFKALAEKSSQKELYAEEIKLAREQAEKRLREKVIHDTENAKLLDRQRKGQPVNDRVRKTMREEAEAAAQKAVSEAADQLTRQAEKFVARHPNTQLQQAAMKVHSVEASKKAAEKYFGKKGGRKGLIERTGMVLTEPFRTPINDRIEKMGKVVTAARSNTPLASVAMLGSEAVIEQAEKAVTKALETPVKEFADKFKDSPQNQKANSQATKTNASATQPTAVDSSVVLGILDKAMEEYSVTDLESFESDLQKGLNMKEDD